MEGEPSATAVLLVLPRFVLLAVSEYDGELEQAVETTADVVGCADCGAVATPHLGPPSPLACAPRIVRPQARSRAQTCPPRPISAVVTIALVATLVLRGGAVGDLRTMLVRCPSSAPGRPPPRRRPPAMGEPEWRRLG